MNGFKHQHESIGNADNKLSETTVNGQHTAKNLCSTVELSNDLV